MSRTFAQAVLADLYAPQTSECWLKLLTIEHEDLDAPIRLVSDHQDLVSRGNTYMKFAFDFAPPVDQEGELPRVSIVIDNVSQLLVDLLRQDTRTAPALTLEIVALSDPDVVLSSWTFDMRQVTWNVDTVRADVAYEPLAEEPFPVGDFVPLDFPGLFNATAARS